MEKIKISIDSKEITIGVNHKICNGFYIADDINTVISNNKILGIEFDSNHTNSEPQHRITKIDQYSFVTTKAEHGYFQHIIFPTIDEKGFKDYVTSLSFPELQQMLNSAFLLRSKITLG